MLKTLNLKNNKELPKLVSVLLDQAFMSLTTLLTSIVLARTYTKINYADLVLLFSITIFTLGFQSAIISKPYAISLNDFKKHQIRSYFQFNLNLKIAFTIGVIVVFPLLYYMLFDAWYTSRFLLFLFYILTHSSYFFVRETLLSERKTKQNLTYGLACSVSLMVLLFFIFFNKLQDIQIFIGIASIIYGGIACVYFIKNFQWINGIRKQYFAYWNMNWTLGKWLLGSNFLFHISSNIYPWLLLYITTKDDIAVFGVLMSIAGLVNPVLTALSSYLLPIFVKMNKNFKSIDQKLKLWVVFFMGAAVVLVLIGYFIGQQLIALLFGSKYGNLGLIVLYPFVVQAITIVFQPYKIVLNAIKRTDVNFSDSHTKKYHFSSIGLFFYY
ncbi:polysaccharide biosynthesis protein [Lacinutrix neustonica]|uniref:Polysaccharide biosynthesis protein n=1 Tax=Lacinutrix neustonica TaxID=2980107 RepID=A0A9E8MUF5_9FLAO|nr:polysaccharide biosynthesis protein [Lacinutrix neustonica]WAC01150.1 polysaccharide biosynthesis protein [Lacinutrix neustonica]